MTGLQPLNDALLKSNQFFIAPTGTPTSYDDNRQAYRQQERKV